MFPNINIKDPKRDSENTFGRGTWYPYYAGFSATFTYDLVKSLDIDATACIVDPWNGSGTTTTIAAGLGYRTIGYDLNPVMVIVAKARMLSVREKNSIWPLAVNIVRKAFQSRFLVNSPDPLGIWLTPESVVYIRRLERALQLFLVDGYKYHPLISDVNGLSDLAAFFYVALFRTVRISLNEFVTSNPTWIKKPKKGGSRIKLDRTSIFELFKAEVRTMIESIDLDPLRSAEVEGQAELSVASSESLPIQDRSVDFILSSPPYCTRIDYAVATMPELAVLGYDPNGDLQNLRRQLIGTSTVPKSVPMRALEWGPTCLDFLDQVEKHPSKASSTYYLKNHIQYFDAIYRSIGELSRVLKPLGGCVIVIQDSFYKDVHNNLPQILIEMANSRAFQLVRRLDFGHSKTMAGINPNVRSYRNQFNATESVLCFTALNERPA
jgi:SAM-dependent methyltransferase